MKVLKYATGQNVPEGAVYLWSCMNGTLNTDAGEYLKYPTDYKYVWHYFLVKEAIKRNK